MSDFDKEAEREKLREKYERDEAERQATQQMSELLLQGATMTNAHCDDHGDPVFRYDGEEFCPTCRAEGQERQQGSGAGGQGETGTGDGEAREDAGTGGQGTRTKAGADSQGGQREDGPGDGRGTPRTERGARPRADDVDRSRPDPSDSAGAGDGRSPGRSAADPPDPDHRGEVAPGPDDRSPDRRGDPPASGGRTAPGRGDGDLATAEASLRRTLVRFARRAEETDDPRRAREDLRVAREAAETLAALHD